MRRSKVEDEDEGAREEGVELDDVKGWREALTFFRRRATMI